MCEIVPRGERDQHCYCVRLGHADNRLTRGRPRSELSKSHCNSNDDEKVADYHFVCLSAACSSAVTKHRRTVRCYSFAPVATVTLVLFFVVTHC